MRLRSFLSLPEVVAKLKPLRPPPPRHIGCPIVVPPRSAHYSLIGTAFDYLLQFEIKRRAPYTVADSWAAECASSLLCLSETAPDGRLRSHIADDQLARVAPLVVGDPEPFHDNVKFVWEASGDKVPDAQTPSTGYQLWSVIATSPCEDALDIEAFSRMRIDPGGIVSRVAKNGRSAQQAIVKDRSGRARRLRHVHQQ